MIRFADLISPIKIDQFFSENWEKEFLLISKNQTGFYNDILNLNDLDRYFQNQQLPATYIKVTKPGESYLPEQWSRLDVRREYHALHIVDVDKLFSLMRDGASLVISGGHKSIPGLTSFITALERELKFCIQINIYITPPQSQGLPLHYDTHDVFILQISGSKHWRLYDSPEKSPVRQQRFRTGNYSQTDLQRSFDLHEGDLAYIPRGLVHEASTSESNSVHITLGLLPNCWFHLIESLADVAKNDPEFRQALPHGFTSEPDKAEFSKKFEKKFQDLLQAFDVETLLDQQSAGFAAQRLKNHQGRFNDLLLFDQLSISSIVCKRSIIDYQITDYDRHIAVTFDDHQITVPLYLSSALQTILQDDPFKIGDLQGLLSDQGKVELVEQFITTGFLRIDCV